MRVQDPADPDDTNAVYYPLTDHLGSTSVTAYEDGTYYSELRYKPWGATRFTSGQTPTDFGYTGQRSNTDDFGLMYYVARFYDPALGRFTSADTIVPGVGNPGAWDRYGYVLNNPLKMTDPSGHMSCIARPGYRCPFRPVSRGTHIANETVPRSYAMRIQGAKGVFDVPTVIVAAGIAVQSQWYNQITDSRAGAYLIHLGPSYYAGAGLGKAQISDAQMNGPILDANGVYTGSYGLDGWDQTTDAGARVGMATRIGLSLELCGTCTGKQKLLLAALAQNGSGWSPEFVKLTENGGFS